MKVIHLQHILEERNLQIIREVVANDGVVIYPTDTLYGIGGNFCSSKVVETIDRIKGRSTMPYSVVVSDIQMLSRLVADIPEVFHSHYKQLLPGKFTFLFPVSPDIDTQLVKGSSKIGIRIPDVPQLLKLIEILDTPFISTSVNRSGEPAFNEPDKIRQSFADSLANESISLLVDGGPLPPSRGSTILDLTKNPVKCIRKGDDANGLAIKP